MFFIKKNSAFLILTVFLLLIEACSKPALFNEEDYDERLSGGSMTVFDAGAGAFTHAFSMSAFGAFNHEVGDRSFEAPFVSAPAPVNPGLGPLYNHVSCAACHVNDGRGRPSSGSEQLDGMLFRCSLDGSDEHGGPIPVSGYGLQLQPRSIVGVTGECHVKIIYSMLTGAYADGTSYQLQSPDYVIENPYTAVPAGMRISPRMAAPVFGLGLLEAIPESAIIKNEDIADADGDGISGRANRVWNVKEQRISLGRFGWKASQPTLLQQTAGAYNGDIGITNSIFPQENSYGQPQYDGSDKDKTDINDSTLYSVAFYMRTLMVPARRNVSDAAVQEGKALFLKANCHSCHTPVMYTATDVAFPQLSNQRIQPYTDLLLHDMGEGLSDNRADFLASGKEWRTAPLWGIGLTGIVNGHNNYLHDGRARNLEEAILWHGGESENSKEKFRNMPKADRQKLIAFLNSL
ncbi:MAG: di-heme oxidoredictase family protein [Chitinophagales bacterium]